jgi:hypothetical protein
VSKEELLLLSSWFERERVSEDWGGLRIQDTYFKESRIEKDLQLMRRDYYYEKSDDLSGH